MIMNATPVGEIFTYAETCINCGGQIERLTNTAGIKERLERATGVEIVQIIIDHCHRCSQMQFNRIFPQHAE